MSELLIRISLCEGELSQLESIDNEPLVLTPTPAFSTPAFSTFAVYSRIFHSCIFHLCCLLPLTVWPLR